MTSDPLAVDVTLSVKKKRVRKPRAPKPPRPPKIVEPKKVFVEDTILSLAKEEGKNYSEEIRIVVWVIDGKRTAPRLERREKTFDEVTKRVKRSKAKGLTIVDLEIIFDKMPEIKKAFVDELLRPAVAKKEEAPAEEHVESPFI